MKYGINRPRKGGRKEGKQTEDGCLINKWKKGGRKGRERRRKRGRGEVEKEEGFGK